MKCFKKIIPFFFVFTILVSSILPSHAAGVGWGRVGIGEWAEHRGQNGFLEILEDYDQYVTDLDANYGSFILCSYNGKQYLKRYFTIPSSQGFSAFGGSTGSSYGGYRVITDDIWMTAKYRTDASNGATQNVDYTGFLAPYDCYYLIGNEGKITNLDDGLNLYGSEIFCHMGDAIRVSSKYGITWTVLGQPAYLDNVAYFALIRPYEDAPFYSEVTINSRPTSITGDYGIIGDNGSIIKVDGNMIVDESSSTVYNPVTNTTLNYTDYAYDYSDRSYNLTLEDGSTMKVTYGDENVTINEGDTVYNIYYIVPEADQEDDGSGSGGSGDTHSHDYTSEITKLPNCLLSGVRTFTCSCGDSYTKTVPATGHDWQISQQIANTFDPETGEPLTTGYTIYTCATCGEQYKSTDGNAPPNGSTGDDEDGGGLISGLLGAVGDVIGGLIEGVLLLATKALEALVGLGDLLRQMGEALIGFFGGFTDFLGAVFPFLPEETFTILNLGLILMIAAAVFKKFF